MTVVRYQPIIEELSPRCFSHISGGMVDRGGKGGCTQASLNIILSWPFGFAPLGIVQLK